MTPPAERPLRVAMLFFALPPEFAGGGLQGLRLMDELARRGVEVTALSWLPPGSGAPRREIAHGGEIIRFRVPDVPRVRQLVFGLSAMLWLLWNARRWDVLHVHGHHYFDGPSLWLAKRLGRPSLIKSTLLFGPEGFMVPGGRISRWWSDAYRLADRIVALSDELERAFRRDPAIADRIVRLPNGVDTSRFRPASADEKRASRERFGLPRDAFVVVTVGMLYPRKNGAALLRAAPRMRTRPLCLVLAGPKGLEPSDEVDVRDAIAGLPDDVVLRRLGEVPTDDLPELLRAADALTLTSRAEGLPNSLLEGMATGLACIATDIPGSKDVLARGGGRLVQLDDLDALAQQLDALADDPGGRARLGAEARARIEAEYSLDSVAERYLALYAELVGRAVSS